MATITPSQRIIHRVCARVVPTARKSPISLVRSNTDNESATRIPRAATTADSPSSTFTVASVWYLTFVGFGELRLVLDLDDRKVDLKLFCDRGACRCRSDARCSHDSEELIGVSWEVAIPHFEGHHSLTEDEAILVDACDDEVLALQVDEECREGVAHAESLFLGEVVDEVDGGRTEQ